MSGTFEVACEILKKYWGYDDFRPAQKPVLESILSGQDTLALLPTGGGKSLCYQVPGLVSGKTTLVISPIIALMTDQTERLQKLGIPAVALHSGLSPHRLEFELEKVAAGYYAFVYVAPERLLSPSFQAAIQASPPGLVAVDEAHCISQWGYDFRPVYLNISVVREWWPQVQMAAFTATATPVVRQDIITRLAMRRPQVLLTSFQRPNLIYAVVPSEDKRSKMLELLRFTRRSAIVYVRNRRRTFELSQFFQKHGLSATFYHAGLPADVREKHQELWLSGKVRVMVATNAFGMGIDKPDVQLVLHADVPDSPEAYFQEAGRAGRDGRKAYALLIHGPADAAELETSFDHAFPSQQIIRLVFEHLGKILGLQPGMASGATLALDLQEIAQSAALPLAQVVGALKILEKEGYLIFNDEGYQPAQILFRVPYRSVYEFMVGQPEFQPVIEAILRSYPGIFEEYKTCRFAEIARRSGLPMTVVEQKIRDLAERGFLEYLPVIDAPRITFLRPYCFAKDLQFTQEVYGFLKKNARLRLRAMLDYLGNNQLCRARQLLGYFGETDVSDCGDCDVCRRSETFFFSNADLQNAARVLEAALKPGEAHTSQVILAALRCAVNKRNLELLRHLVELGVLQKTENEKLALSTKRPV